MPGIRRRYDSSEPIVYHKPTPSSIPNQKFIPPTSPTMAANIKFIPSLVDTLAGASTQSEREGPLRLVLRDTGVLLKMLKYVPWTIKPFRTDDKQAELYLSPRGARDTILIGVLTFMGVAALLLAPVAVLAFPGFIVVAIAAIFSVVAWFLALPLHGPDVVYSAMDEATMASAKDHPEERWLFINGIATSHRGLQNNVDRLAKTFGRPVIGIHNKTFGLVGDLIECLIQRSMSFSTTDARIAYDYVKACLADPVVKKVILIGHSQGGIIVSLVLDRLFADLPAETMAKLEVYTFGSAASHFNNPRLSLNPRSRGQVTETSNSLPPAERCIPYVEHYANEYDLVPRWGVLYNVTQLLDNRYCGKVFVRMGATGHMFNQHYMDPMFPQDHSQASLFLDQVVDVDEKLAVRRENSALQHMGLMRRESSFSQHDLNLDLGNGETIPVGVLVNGHNADGDEIINFVDPSRRARGKTVRQLSRFWRYVDGGSPLGSAGISS